MRVKWSITNRKSVALSLAAVLSEANYHRVPMEFKGVGKSSENPAQMLGAIMKHLQLQYCTHPHPHICHRNIHVG